MIGIHLRYHLLRIYFDPNVRLRNGAIHADFNIKFTLTYMYLHNQSSHSVHIKTSILYDLALGFSRIYSSEKDFKTHAFHMKEWFLERGYPEIFVNNQTDKVVLDQSVKENLESGIPLSL